MCNASAIGAVINGGLGIAEMGVGVTGVEQEQAANADISRFNRTVAERSAADALQRGAQQEGAVRLQGAQLGAQQQTAAAASGVDVKSGSALDALASSAGMTELDALTVRNNAAREAYGFKVASAEISQQARLRQMKLEQQKVQTILGGVGKMFSSVGGAAGGVAQSYGGGD